MRSRIEIEDQFKDIIVPAGSGHIKLQIELLLDIRDLLEELVTGQRITEAREARERAAAERERLMGSDTTQEEDVLLGE